MSGRKPDPTTVRRLLAFADELGWGLSPSTARSMCGRHGFEAARERLERSVALMDRAARDLGVEIDLRTASRRLALAGFDVPTALARLRDQVAEGRRPADAAAGLRLATYAAERGVELSPARAAVRASDDDGDPYALVRAVARVLDVATDLGIALDARSAWARVTRAGGDADAVVARLRSRATNRWRRRSGLCRLLGRPRGATREEQLNSMARCGCDRRCGPRVRAELEPYTATIVRHESPSMLTREEAWQEADLALLDALEDWSSDGSFTSFYGTVLANRFTSIARWWSTEGRGGESPLSLDSAVFEHATGRRVELVETVPDRTKDTAKIAMARLRIAELIAARRAAAVAACDAYQPRSP